MREKIARFMQGRYGCITEYLVEIMEEGSRRTASS